MKGSANRPFERIIRTMMTAGQLEGGIMKRKHRSPCRFATQRAGGQEITQTTRYNIPSFDHAGIDYVYLSLGTPDETGLNP